MATEFASLEEIKNAVVKLEVSRDRNINPFFVNWYTARRILSNFSWDLFTAYCYQHFIRTTGASVPPRLTASGMVTGVFDEVIAERLLKAFRECPPYDPPVSGHEIAYGHFFGPGVTESTAENVRKMFVTRQITEEMRAVLKDALDSLKSELEVAMGHFWSVPHVRLYERRPEQSAADQGWHTDGWPMGIKKLYIYLEGAGLDLGTTQLQLPDGTTATVEGKPGVWALFENSIVVHRALSSEFKWRPAIEVSIVPAMVTDTYPNSMGITGNFPWLPVTFPELDHPAMPASFQSRSLEYRCLMRTMGLARAVEFKDCSLGMDPFHIPEGWIFDSILASSAEGATELPPSIQSLKPPPVSLRQRLGARLRKLLQAIF